MTPKEIDHEYEKYWCRGTYSQQRSFRHEAPRYVRALLGRIRDLEDELKKSKAGKIQHVDRPVESLTSCHCAVSKMPPCSWCTREVDSEPQKKNKSDILTDAYKNENWCPYGGHAQDGSKCSYCGWFKIKESRSPEKK